MLQAVSYRKTKREWLIFLLIIAGGLTCFLWFHLEIRNISYENQLLMVDKKKILEENERLKIEQALINSPVSIEKMAAEKLNLIRPKEKQFRYIK